VGAVGAHQRRAVAPPVSRSGQRAPARPRLERGMSFAPEDRLVLRCARIDPSERALGEARALLAGPLDWDYVVESAVRHGVAPLVHRTLARLEPPATVPAAELAQLAAVSERRSVRLFGVVTEIVAALAAAGVRTLGLKDLGLALEVYPEPGLRP